LDVVSQIDTHAQVLFIGRAAVPVHNMHMHNATCILHLPRAEALSFALGSDFLLVVMPSFAKWIPAKMYDYLRIGKPILALVPEDGDAARIVKEAKAGFILSYDSRMMKLQLEKIFEQSKRGDFKDVHPDWEYVKQFEWRKRTERIAKVFDEVAG
jgi:glycosyltransferase involved in cell wall biosynthesis